MDWITNDRVKIVQSFDINYSQKWHLLAEINTTSDSSVLKTWDEFGPDKIALAFDNVKQINEQLEYPWLSMGRAIFYKSCDFSKSRILHHEILRPPPE